LREDTRLSPQSRFFLPCHLGPSCLQQSTVIVKPCVGRVFQQRLCMCASNHLLYCVALQGKERILLRTKRLLFYHLETAFNCYENTSVSPFQTKNSATLFSMLVACEILLKFNEHDISSRRTRWCKLLKPICGQHQMIPPEEKRRGKAWTKIHDPQIGNE